MKVLRRHTTASWVDAFFERYLDFARIDRVLGEAGAAQSGGGSETSQDLDLPG